MCALEAVFVSRCLWRINLHLGWRVVQLEGVNNHVGPSSVHAQIVLRQDLPSLGM